MVRFVIFLFFALLSISGTAQDLLQSRRTSKYTYIFKLTDKEARKIYKKEIWEVDRSYFHSLVDSFPTDSTFNRILPEGHYLKAYTKEEKLNVELTTVQNIDIRILNNNTDLNIQVYNSLGKTVSNARVKIGGKVLHYDKKLSGYVDRKSNNQGLLQVTRDGFTTFYMLRREYNNPQLDRTLGKILYSIPIKYVWIPVNFILNIPDDLVHSLIRRHPNGTIYHIKNFSVNTYTRVVCLFDDCYCDEYDDEFNDKHKGYLVFNKPIYLPGDTVKFKAFVVNKKGKPIIEEMDVVIRGEYSNSWTLVEYINSSTLDGYSKSIKLTTLSPYRPGAFEYEFVLADSLKLKLDNSYSVILRSGEYKDYISGSFKYEDYELSQINLEVRTEEDVHYRGSELKVFVKGTDENELNLLDARLEVFVKAGMSMQYYQQNVFIKDTLLYTTKKVDTENETILAIPDSIFPAADLMYDVDVRLITSDNQALSRQKTIHYFAHKIEIVPELIADSMNVAYRVDGVNRRLEAEIFGIDNFFNETSLGKLTLPANLAISPYYNEYRAVSDSVNQRFSISEESPLIQCLSERTNDSIRVIVDNPRNIPFSYLVYRKNNELTRGYGTSFSFQDKAPKNPNYFVSLQYLWAGEVKTESYKIPSTSSQLTIQVSQPVIIYPGQKSEIEIAVMDHAGKPVADADLTAYAYTKKFKATIPDLPDLSKERRNKYLINNFRLETESRENAADLYLDYPTWRVLAGLDSIEYYDFLYPGNGIYIQSHAVEDSTTQFAPFVMRNGIQPVHVIYVDYKPVYFSWTENAPPYSFPIDSGYHQVKLRTRYKVITIDSLFFPYGQKTIFSLNDTLGAKNIHISQAETKLTEEEFASLYRYIFPYRNSFKNQITYLEQDKRFQLLSGFGNNQASLLGGPVTGSHVKVKTLEGPEFYFAHEPFFEYDFSPGILKMRSVDADARYPKNLGWNAKESIYDLVLTEERIMQMWRDRIEAERYSKAKYSNPDRTKENAGTLFLDYVRKDNSKVNPLNVLVFKYTDYDFIRVYPGSKEMIYDLDKGLYRIIYFYPGAGYHSIDSLYIRINGLNYVKIQEPDTLTHNEFGKSVNDIIEKTIFQPADYDYKNKNQELEDVKRVYRNQYTYNYNGRLIEGFVYDGDAKDALPGVNVIAKGTTFGTVTDMDGFYSLTIPPDVSTLVFASVGYVTAEINIQTEDFRHVDLYADVTALREIIVTGYGTTQKSDLTGAISTVHSTGIPGSIGMVSTLQGRVAGITINHDGSSPENMAIQIRGASTIPGGNSPLYIINGQVFTGDYAELHSEDIEKIEVLKGDEATAIYGARAINGVILITMKKGITFNLAGQTIISEGNSDDILAGYDAEANAIRNNFSDYGFWEPRLKTNAQGIARFPVTFPDDVTKWQTFVLAMTDKRQSGAREGAIRSFKPLMAQLALPRFMVAGDSITGIGKILNYTLDSIALTRSFEINDSAVFTLNESVGKSTIDSLRFTTSTTDSLRLKYYLKRSDGYLDGEERNITVVPQGMEETKGLFMALNNDTTVTFNFDPKLGEVKFYAQADLLEVLEKEIDHVIGYRYDCNEQLASKLKMLLAKKNISEFKGVKAQNDQLIVRLINHLSKNTNSNGIWGWWQDSGTDYWITVHVMEALLQAKWYGFNIYIPEKSIMDNLFWQLQSKTNTDDKIRILRLFKMANQQIDYQQFIRDMEKFTFTSITQYFRFQEMKRFCGFETSADSLMKFSKSTMMGNLYFSDTVSYVRALSKDIEPTLLAYKIMSYDSSRFENEMQKIRNYFLERRNQGHWINTYESAKIVEAILPGILKGKKEATAPKIWLTGSVTEEVKVFPYNTSLSPNDVLTISKTGDFPVYITAHQRWWNNAPDIHDVDFEINTWFENQDRNILDAGKPVKMIVSLNVKKDAEFVMVEVPIPAGCSYQSKTNSHRDYFHREYFKDRTSIFCEFLKAGTYQFEIDLLPRFSGFYHLNPAKAELMYFPVIFGNTDIKTTWIK